MPDVQEVFHMATQKVHPEPGFADRQQDHQRRRQRIRKVGAFAVAAAIAVAGVAVFLEARGGPTATPADEPSSTASGFSRVYESGGKIFVSGENGSPVALTSGFLPTPSPDGTMIAFLRDPRDQHYAKSGDPFVLQAWLISPDGSGRRKLGQQHECCIGASPDLYWSPDGSSVVLTGIHEQRLDAG
jgi:hypothetical protein